MGVLIKKSHGLYHLTGISKLGLVGLITSLAGAAIGTIWAIYLDSFLHSEVYVGLLSAALTVVALISYFVFIPIIERADKSKIYSYSLFVFIVSYLLFAINKNIYLLILLSTIITIFLTLRTTSFGILIKDSSKKQRLTKNMGIIYTFMNIAFVVGPLIAGYIVSQFGISWVFVIGATFMFISLLVFQASGTKGTKGIKKPHRDLIKNFIAFFKNKDRILAYIITGGVSVWWMLIYLFTPLMIIRSGLGEIWIGYFLFAVALPLVVFEYVFAKQANKKGFKRIFKMGYLGVTIISFLCFYFSSNIFVTLSLLAAASIGMAMLEPTTEAYFFDVLKRNEEYRFYGPYRTSYDVGGFVGKVSAAVLLIFLPFKFLFILFGIFMFLLFLTSFKTKNIVESRK